MTDDIPSYTLLQVPQFYKLSENIPGMTMGKTSWDTRYIILCICTCFYSSVCCIVKCFKYLLLCNRVNKKSTKNNYTHLICLKKNVGKQAFTSFFAVISGQTLLQQMLVANGSLEITLLGC